MGQLTNLYVSQSYQGLLKLQDSTTGVTGTLQYVQDGLGNNLPMLASTSSIVITGSFRGDGSGLTGITIDSGSLVTTSSFNAYTSSNDTRVNSLINATGSYATTSSLSSLSGSIATTDLAQNNRLNSIESITGSLATTGSLNSYLLTSSFNAYTSSNDTKVNALIAQTGSYVTETESGSFVTSVTGVSDTITVTKGNGTTNTVTVNNVVNATSASFAQTSVSSSQAQNAVSSSFATNAISSSFATNAISSSFATNAISSSFATNAVSSSYATNAATASIANDVIVVGKCDNLAGLTRGTIVRITGAVGDNPLFNVASWEDDQNSANTIGMLSEDVVYNAFANIVVLGKVTGINTSGMTAGDVLYLSSSGQYTNQIPPTPYHEVRLGQVLRAQLNNGSAYITVDNGYELTELHDVNITTPVAGDLLVYTTGSYGQWVNKSPLQAGLITTGSNTFNGTQVISGSLYVTDTLYATSASITYVTSSQISVTGNTIAVNIAVPAQRFGGLVAYDSGSSNATASLLWDSQKNHWIYENVTGAMYTGGGLLSGPKHTGSLGDEPYPTLNTITRGQGGDHLYDSNITDDDTVITMKIKTDVSGSLSVTNGITGSLLGNASTATSASHAAQAVSSSHSLNADTAISSSFAQNSVSSSFAQNAVSASYAPDTTNTGSFLVSATLSSVNGTISLTSVNGSGTSFQQGTTNILTSVSSSYSNYAVSSSQSQNAVSSSHSINSDTAISSSFATNAISSSYASNAGTAVSSSFATNAVSSSHSINSDNAISSSFATNAISSSHSVNSDNAISSSFAQNAISSSYASNAGTAVSSSFATNADTAVSSSYAQNADTAVSSSFATNAISSSQAQNAVSASFAPMPDVSYFATTGSNNFVGQQNINGNVNVTGSLVVTNGITGSLEGSSSFAQNSVSSSYAVTASYALNANVNSGSFATTGSNVFSGSQFISGSVDISGSLFMRGERTGSLIGRNFSYVTSSLTSGGNIFFQDVVVANTVSQSLVVSSSNNIIFNRPTANSNVFDNVILGSTQGSNIYSVPPQISVTNRGQILPVSMSHNIGRGTTAPFLLQFSTGSLTGSATINNNIVAGTVSFNTSQDNRLPFFVANNVNGSFTYNSVVLGFNSIPTVRQIQSNNINGTVTSTARSGSISITNNNLNGTVTFVNDFIGGLGAIGTSQIMNVNNNNIGGSVTLNSRGTSAVNLGRIILNNTIQGNSIIIVGRDEATTSGSFVNSLVVGQSLTITGSHADGTVNTGGGSVFLGRYNETGSLLSDSEQTVFALGTGTGATARRTSLFVSSSGLLSVRSGMVQSGSLELVNNRTTGSLNISGSDHTVTGSLSVSGTLNVRGGGLVVSGVQTQTNGEIVFNGGTFFAQPMENFVKLNATSTTTLTIDNFNLNTPASQSLWNSTVDTGSNYSQQQWEATNGGTTGRLQLTNAGGVTTYTLDIEKTVITGSVQGNVLPLTVNSNTASLNLDSGNFFVLALTGSQDIRIEPSNVKPGQTINLKLNTTGSGTVSFPTSVKQVSGSSYVPTTTTGVDVVTLVSFDSNDLYLASVKNLI